MVHLQRRGEEGECRGKVGSDRRSKRGRRQSGSGGAEDEGAGWVLAVADEGPSAVTVQPWAVNTRVSLLHSTSPPSGQVHLADKPPCSTPLRSVLPSAPYRSLSTTMPMAVQSLDTISNPSDDSYDSDEDDRLAEQEWRESIQQLQQLLSIVLLPYLGK